MDWKRLANRAVRVGVRQGIDYLQRSGKDTKTLRVVEGLLPDDERSSRSGTRSSSDRRSASRKPRGEKANRRRSAETASAPARGDDGQPIQPGADPRDDGFARSRPASRRAPKQGFPKRPDGGYPGDYTGRVKPVYKPDLDGDADPGEIVWAWVPYEEDRSKGKDRPVLIVGHEGRWLLGLMLTSKDNVPGEVGSVHEDEHGARYLNLGSGDWDEQRRPSEVRLDRVIRIDEKAVRREGAILPMARFSHVVDALG